MLSIEEQYIRSDIDDYIHDKSSILSRYEIDKHLLSEGYRSDWIEESWQDQTKKQQSLTRYKRTEKAVIIINIALLIWFFKPNISLFILSQTNDNFNQFTIYPLVVVFTVAVIIWQIRSRYGRYVEKKRVFLTIAPLILIILLPVINFFCYWDCDISKDDLEMRKNQLSQHKSYTYYETNKAATVYVSYNCDSFGIVCFEHEYRSL